MRVTFSQHAVERYSERCGRTITLPQALAELQALSKSLNFNGRTMNGDNSYRCENGGRLVVRRQHGNFICVTVLLPNENDGADIAAVPVVESDPRQAFVEATQRVVRYMKGRAQRGDREAERLIGAWLSAQAMMEGA